MKACKTFKYCIIEIKLNILKNILYNISNLLYTSCNFSIICNLLIIILFQN